MLHIILRGGVIIIVLSVLHLLKSGGAEPSRAGPQALQQELGKDA